MMFMLPRVDSVMWILSFSGLANFGFLASSTLNKTINAETTSVSL